jgi:hypothetical protein
MWEKSNQNHQENFSIADIDMDDEVIKSLIEKDTDPKNSQYKLK